MKLSVAMCTFNGSRFLGQQLDSILEQDLPVTEIVVCDDASTDDTLLLLQGYAQAHPGLFRLYHNNTNLGVAQNFEQAVRHCTGDIIFFADQDDAWEKHKTSQTLQYFEQHDDAWGVFTDAILVDEANAPLGATLWQGLQFREALDAGLGADLFRYLLLYRNAVTGACLAIRKEAVGYVLPFPVDGSMLHDQWIGLKLGTLGRLSMLDACFTRYRVHGSQATKSLWQNNTGAGRALRSALIRNDAGSIPYAYYRFWKKKLPLLHRLQGLGITIGPQYFTEVKEKTREGALAYLKSLPLLKRKFEMIRLLLKGEKEITILDAVTQ